MNISHLIEISKQANPARSLNIVTMYHNIYVSDSLVSFTVSEERMGDEYDLMNPNFLAAANKELAEQFLILEKEADQERMAKL